MEMVGYLVEKHGLPINCHSSNAGNTYVNPFSPPLPPLYHFSRGKIGGNDEKWGEIGGEQTNV